MLYDMCYILKTVQSRRIERGSSSDIMARALDHHHRLSISCLIKITYHQENKFDDLEIMRLPHGFSYIA